MRLGEAASEPTLAADSPAASFGRSAAAAICPQISRSRHLAPSGRECSEIGWAPRSRGGNSPRSRRGQIRGICQLDEAEKASSPQSESEGFAIEAEGCRDETHRVPYTKKMIDRFRFEE